LYDEKQLNDSAGRLLAWQGKKQTFTDKGWDIQDKWQEA